MTRLPERTFSPAQLAKALQISESTLKRWIDAGHLQAMKTAGGHRRVAFKEIMRFIREERLEVPHPELLGLTNELGEAPVVGGETPLTARHLVAAFQSNDPAQARGLLVGAFLRGASLVSLCDGPVREAMQQMGTLWGSAETVDHTGIYLEHQATDLILQAFGQIRSLVPPPPRHAPVALGGALPGDPYLLPAMMASAVLADLGFESINLGPNSPVETFLEAAQARRPHLVWVSISSPDVLPLAEEWLVQLAAGLGAGSQLVVGGREARALASIPPGIRRAERMGDLVQVARPLLPVD